jgi:hypothetical protein
MNAGHLAQSVVYWLEYERLCGRERLFRELSLVRPIHDYLSAIEPATIELEFPIPNLPAALAYQQGQKKALDVCLRRPTGGRAIQDVVETKLVRGDRDFTQEIIDDLFRLEWIREPRQHERFDRWFLIAGEQQDLHAHVITNQINPGNRQPRIACFEDVLSFDLRSPEERVEVHGAVPNLRDRWCKAARKLGQNVIPLSFSTTLIAKFPPQAQQAQFQAWVWRVTSAHNRQTRPI